MSDRIHNHRHRRHRGHRLRNTLLAVGGAVLVVAALGVFRATTTYLPALDDAKAAKVELERLVDRARVAGLAMTREDLDAMRADLDSAQARFDTLAGLLDGDPAVALARVFPFTGDTVRGTDATMDAAGELLIAADAALGLVDRYVAIKEQQATSGDGGSSIAQLVELMATGAADVDAAVAAIDRADALLATTPADLPGPIAQVRDLMREKVAEYGPAMRGYAEVDDILPSILGWGAARTYLILTQNPAELRPTGGFIGSFGTMTFDDGRIAGRQFQDVFLLDVPHDYPWIDAPDELRRYLLGDFQPWQLADANWSPDFPTSARDAIRLYENEDGPADVAGVIAISTYTIDEILKVTGPITVPGYDVTIASGETTLKVLQNTRLAQEGENRKAFLSVFAEELFSTLFALPPSKWLELAADADKIGNERLVQVWLEDAAAQAQVVDLGLDGAVRQDAGDYLYPVDSNVMPASKLNAVTDRSVDVSVELDDVGNATNTLKMRWTNTIDTPEAQPYREIPTLEELDTLGMYFRLLVPARSRLEGVEAGTTTPIYNAETIGEEAGRDWFGNYFRIPAGTARLRYQWVSPYPAEEAEDGIWEYRLTIQKQPGARPGPIRIAITLPEGATMTEASPGLTLVGETLTAETTFDRDIVAVVRYRLPEEDQ